MSGRQHRGWRLLLLPVLWALVAALLLTVVGTVAVREDRRSVRRDATVRVRSNADAAIRALARQTQDYLRTARATAANADVVAALAAPTSRSLSAAEGPLSTLAIGKRAPAAFLSDVQGRYVAGSPLQKEVLGVSFAYRDWFQGVSTSRRPYVSSGYRSVAIGRPLVVGVAAPVRDGRRLVGYLTVLWQLDSVRAVAEGARRDDGVAVTVTDQRGQALTSSLAVDGRGQPEAVEVPPATQQALAGRSVDTVEAGDFIAAGPVPDVGWTVAASLPQSTALAPARTFTRNLLSTLALAFLILLAVLAAAAFGTLRRGRQRAASAERAERMRALFAALPIGIVQTLPDGTILAANDALATLLGFSTQELLTMRADDLSHPTCTAETAETQQRILDGDVDSCTTEQVYRSREGAAVPVLATVVALIDASGTGPRIVTFVVDQSRQREDADALQTMADSAAEREMFLLTLLDTMDVSVLACDREGTLIRVNDEARRVHGLEGDQTLDLSALPVAHLDGGAMRPDEAPLRRALSQGKVSGVELLVHQAGGRASVRVVTNAQRLEGPDGSTVGAVSTGYDVTALRATEAALRITEDRFRRVFDEAITGNALADDSGLILLANQALATLLDVDAGELRGTPLADCFAERLDKQRIEALLEFGEGQVRAEMSLHGSSGEVRWGRVALHWVLEEQGQRVLMAQIEDVTARRLAEQRLRELALHDDLTGLPNRRLLLERCTQAFAVARSGRSTTSVSALFVDLDGFKAVNDRAGHLAGDHLLQSIAHDLVQTLRPADTVARVGGDEFVVLLGDDDGIETVRLVADRIGRKIRRQVPCEGASLSVSASIGIARADLALELEMDPEQLLRRADAAMYRAKERGRDRQDVFDSELLAVTEARYELEQAVRDGLDHDRIKLVYQPVVDLDSGAVLGAEALMRLTDRDGRPVPTLPAIVAAEHAGLAEAVGDRVLELALETLRGWPAHMTVAVNVSTRELTGDAFRRRVETALLHADIDPVRLVLEITESSILHAGRSSLGALESLRASGVRVAIDDFGTAYATLQNLTVLPVDLLKVDGSFTAGLGLERAATAVVHGVITMAGSMGVPCIVEGIETPLQHEALRGLGVQGQGWVWGKPKGREFTPSVVMPGRQGARGAHTVANS